MSRRDEREPQPRWLIAISAALFLSTVALYAPTLGHDFVNYDDGDYVTGNTQVQGGLTWSNVVWAFTTGHASNWHPLTWISHMLDCQFYGLQPGGHHATNIFFHAIDAVLLFWILFRMTDGVWPSAFVAALFAWHPAHVESVAWVSERKDVLSAMFWLLTMLAYARYVEASKVQSPKSKVYYGVALLCFVLGLISKPMLVTLPFVLLLMDYWPLARFMGREQGDAMVMRNMGEGKANPTKSRGGKRTKDTPPALVRDGIDGKNADRVSAKWLVIEKVPFLLLAIISSVVTFMVQRKGGAVSPLNVLPVSARIANAFVSYLRYAGKIFWPEDLSVLYPHPVRWPMGLVAVSVMFVVGVSVGVVLVTRSRPHLAVGWFWFLGTLVPVIGLVQVGVQSMADRYTYIPAVGLFIMVAWGAAELEARRPGFTTILNTAGAVALVACIGVTMVQISYWQNGETLFRHVVKATDKNYLAYNNLGYYLFNHGKSAEAMECYQKSVEINPNYEEAQNNLGHALNAAGRVDEAIAHLKSALRIKPGLVPALNNLGNALSNQGKLDDAIAEYVEALKYDPNDEDAHNNLGIARAMQGRLDDAVTELTEAVRLKPSDSGAHSNLGNAYAAKHKLDEAAKEYQIALKLNPEDSQPRNNLGNVLSEQGRYDEAAENYRQALKLKADNPEANFNLGMALLRQGKTAEATQHFTEAVRLKPDYPQARQQLEALRAARGP